VARWVKKPYWQHFCGETFFQHRLLLDPRFLTRLSARLVRQRHARPAGTRHTGCPVNSPAWAPSRGRQQCRLCNRRGSLETAEHRVREVQLDRRGGIVPSSRGSSFECFTLRQTRGGSVPADPKIQGNLASAQAILKMSLTHLKIQIHGVYPQTLPNTERAKLADFYALRDSTMPPLPWPSIAPPITLSRWSFMLRFGEA